MTTWLSDFSRTFLGATLDLLWRQWSGLGVPSSVAEMEAWIVDPEALLVGTIQFGRYDPRLFDAALDWCLDHGKWFSTTRLRWLRKDLTSEEARILSAVASALTSHDGLAKWRSIRRATEEGGSLMPPIPLFLTREDRPLPSGTARDPVFLRDGVVRAPWERGRGGRRLKLTRPGALRLRLRALFGIGSHAEIVIYLLTHRGGHPRRVARQINHAQPPVARAMAEMAQAGFLTANRTAREVEYTIAQGAWRRFLDAPAGLGWIQWGLAFRALRMIWACLQEMRERPVTAAVAGSQLITCSEQVNPVLRESELEAVFAPAVPGRPEDYIATFVEGTRKLFRRMGTTVPIQTFSG